MRRLHAPLLALCCARSGAGGSRAHRGGTAGDHKGGAPVLVTPVVRRWFDADGTLDDGTALPVNGLGVDLPAVARSVAAAGHVPLIDLTARTEALVESLGPEGSETLCLSGGKRDNTHTSVHGATVYAVLVRDELLARHLVPEGAVRVG
ncbi:hypothetical protein GCM10010260_19830 [Streptomyces filipinensis]|uniref:Uncharacterized protein n=1 Tax=Streptomyces filipinensis TaxID=66887 RepID=A0A918I937_9ACTN|nr:hypothetical protein GCM10010260_19830 [Streptomyces filipinensis]